MTLKEAYEYLINYRKNVSKKETIDYAIARVLSIVKCYCDEIDKEKLINKIDDISKINHEYVDLGLSVKWATCNVGATCPEEYGDYFAWGETEPKDDYSWETYKYGSSYDALTKYNTDSDYGTVDNKTRLKASDDAATANWGSAWRMPTDSEWTELREQCEWIWTDNYQTTGVAGYWVIGKNGNSIFLPAAGFRSEGRLNNVGYYGDYWSSSLNMNCPSSTWVMYFYSNYKLLKQYIVSREAYHRCYGLSIRPVYEETKLL